MFISKITAISKCIKRNSCGRGEKLLRLCARRCLLKCNSILPSERECASALIAVDVMRSHFPSYSSFICVREWKKNKKKGVQGVRWGLGDATCNAMWESLWPRIRKDSYLLQQWPSCVSWKCLTSDGNKSEVGGCFLHAASPSRRTNQILCKRICCILWVLFSCGKGGFRCFHFVCWNWAFLFWVTIERGRIWKNFKQKIIVINSNPFRWRKINEKEYSVQVG